MWKTVKGLVLIGLLLLVKGRIIPEDLVDNSVPQQQATHVDATAAPASLRPTPDLHMFDNKMKQKKVFVELPPVTGSEEALVYSGILKANRIGLHGTQGCPPLYRPVCAGRSHTKYWPPVTFKNDCELYMFNQRYWDADLKILFEDECENWPDREFTHWAEDITF